MWLDSAFWKMVPGSNLLCPCWYWLFIGQTRDSMLLRFCHGCQSRRIKTMYGRFFLVLMPYLCCHDVLRWIFIVCLQFHSLIGCCVWSWHHAHCWHAAGTLSRVLCRFANRFRKIWRVTRYNQVLWPHTAPSVNRWIPPSLTRPHKSFRVLKNKLVGQNLTLSLGSCWGPLSLSAADYIS